MSNSLQGGRGTRGQLRSRGRGAPRRTGSDPRSNPSIGARAVVRGLDLAIAIATLAVASPLLVIVAIAIRLDSSGPAIFRQRRLGLHKRPFIVYKLRTMRTEADSKVHRAYVRALIDGAEVQQEQDETAVYKLTGDDRVTRVGAFLRRSSMDELPQLINVLLGHMSIVGPRPVLSYEADRYPTGFNRRFQVKPGMTGLWQVSGRSTRTYREMVELDIAWVERHSIGLYLSIIARTPRILLKRSEAA